MDPPALVVQGTEEVEQQTYDGHTVRLRKERLLVDGRLALVRKHLVGVQGPRVVLVHGFAQNRYTWHSSRRSFAMTGTEPPSSTGRWKAWPSTGLSTP